MALVGWPRLLTAANAGQREEVESVLEAKVGVLPGKVDLQLAGPSCQQSVYVALKEGTRRRTRTRQTRWDARR